MNTHSRNKGRKGRSEDAKEDRLEVLPSNNGRIFVSANTKTNECEMMNAE
jgi:hypothetical protein